MRLLLDTCTFIWITQEAPRLSERARSLALDPDNEVHLSAVSAWEIVVKHALNKLHLVIPPAAFVPEYRSRHRVTPLPLDEAAVLLLGRLPRLHKDPFDRMLVCQALAGGLTILTPDDLIRQYAVPTAW